MTLIVTQVFIRKALDQVFDYVTTPVFWPQWHPSSAGVDGIDARPATLGDRLDEQVHAAGRRETFRWTVTRCSPPSCWAIDGEFASGKATIAYRLEATADGTLFTRELTYRVRGFWLRLLDGLLLARRIRRESRHALQSLKARLESHRPATE
jgi:hypothetical protein